MARVAKVKKDVYTRIEDKKNEIQKAEDEVKRLNEELKTLYAEQDDLEMHQLLAQARESGLDIQAALLKLGNKK